MSERASAGMVSPAWRAAAARIDLDLRPLRWCGAAMLGVGALLPHLPGHPGLPCPLRTVTGVPCPLCGMTTSVKAVMRADLGQAVAANPFGIVLVVSAVLLLLRPRRRNLPVPSGVLVVGVVLSWVVQLYRFHVL